MSHINKTVSCKSILAAISRTFKPTSSSWMNEAIEDIGWGIQAIGYHAGFEKKQTAPPYLAVRNNRAKIPCDVERIRSVEYLTLDTATENILNDDGTTPDPSTYVEGCTYKGTKLRLGSDESIYGMDDANPRTSQGTPFTNYYSLNSDYVITGFETGLLKLHYIAFATDKDGLPLVVDDFDYKTALQWYCFGNMILKGHKHPELSYLQVNQLFEVHRLRAENACKMPSIDAAEKFAASWNRFAGASEFNSNFFMHLEQPEINQ